MRYLVIAVLLSGCAAIQDAKDEMRVERYARTCAQLGHTPGTEAFRECQTKLMAGRIAR
jgi:hypothetical protein